MSESQYWCGTFNYEDYEKDKDREFVEQRLKLLPTAACPERYKDLVTYCVWQHEKGEQTGHPHIQLYIELKSKRKRDFVKTMITGRPNGTIHLETRKSKNNEDAKNYCMKQDTRNTSLGEKAGPFEQGTFVPNTLAQQSLGKRKLEDLLQDKGVTLNQLMEEAPMWYIKHPQGIKEIKEKQVKPRDSWPEIYILIGPTGCGKTTYVTLNPNYSRSLYAMLWRGANNAKWFWEQYEQQENILMDEFRHQMLYQESLNIFDSKPQRVEKKGTSTELNSKRIFVTTNLDPRTEWYPHVKDRTALFRRLGSNVQKDGTEIHAHLIYFTWRDKPYAKTTDGKPDVIQVENNITPEDIDFYGHKENWDPENKAESFGKHKVYKTKETRKRDDGGVSEWAEEPNPNPLEPPKYIEVEFNKDY